MRKNAQMKMMESVLVLVIFFFLLVFGIGFYISFTRLSDKNKVSESSELYAIESMQRVKYMPELQCTKGGSEVIPDCFDIYKIKAFKAIANNDRYHRLYPGISINITQIYPPDKTFGKKGQMIYENRPKNATGQEFFFLPLSLYNPINRTYAFGFATIGVYN
jgi:hypothetical protein